MNCVGGVLSPLLSNVALSVLDEHFARAPGGPASTSWERAKRRRLDLPNYRLVRYADDWTLMVAGTRNDAVALREEAAQVLARVGLHLSEEKTLITHIDEGLDFLGWRIQRHRKRGANQHYVYTYPSRKALRAAMAKVRMWCRQVGTNQPLDVLLARINPLLKGMDGVLPPRGVQRDLPVPGRLRLAPGSSLDPPQAPRDLAEGIPPPLLRRRMVAQGPGTGVVRRRAGHHDPVSLPGIGDPLTLAAGRGMRTRHGP